MFRSSLKAMLLGAALVLFAAPAFAQNVTITGVTGGGTGCPSNSSSITALLQGNQASVIFSNYKIETNERQRTATASCALRMALKFAQPGITLSVTQINWLGTIALARGSQARFNRAFTIVGQTPVSTSTTFDNRSGNNPFPEFSLEDQVGAVTFSSCRGASTILGANTSLALQGVGSGSVDTADVQVFDRMILTLRIGSTRC